MLVINVKREEEEEEKKERKKERKKLIQTYDAFQCLEDSSNTKVYIVGIKKRCIMHTLLQLGWGGEIDRS